MTVKDREEVLPVEAELRLAVESVVDEAEGVRSLVLRDPHGGELPTWQPGAHIDVFVGPNEVRQYSLSGDPTAREYYRISVLREADGKGGSAWIHDHLRAGDQVTIRGPRNHFALEPAESYVFVAGGIGITPILTMIQTCEVSGKDWRLLYGGRSASSMSFLQELAPYGGRVEIYDHSMVGDIPLATIDPSRETLVYACGPEPLLAACESMAEGWPAGSLHLERFAAREIDHSDDAAFEVVLAQSDLRVQIPASSSILQVLQERGLSAMSSCEEGLCGTCEVGVLAGEVEHRDEVLSDEERESGETMMICVSRARSATLTIDL